MPSIFSARGTLMSRVQPLRNSSVISGLRWNSVSTLSNIIVGFSRSASRKMLASVGTKK
jgi:hypothetical protein